jgi:small subunit ribosomal protein S11e
MTEVQTEKAFQKQAAVTLNGPKLIGKRTRKSGTRYYKDIGLGFKTPRAAIEGKFIDKKCPFTGDVSIRGAIVKGVVQSTRMNRTIVVRRDYLHYLRKYNRFEKRHTNVSAHLSPAFNVKVGDVVTIGQCRPLSKTVRFNVIAHEPVSEYAAKVFRIF